MPHCHLQYRFQYHFKSVLFPMPSLAPFSIIIESEFVICSLEMNSEKFSNNFITDKILIKSLADKLDFLKRLIIHRKYIYRIFFRINQFFTFKSQRFSIICVKVSQKYTFLNPVKPIALAAVTDFLTDFIFRNIIYYPDKQTQSPLLLFLPDITLLASRTYCVKIFISQSDCLQSCGSRTELCFRFLYSCPGRLFLFQKFH